MKRLIIILLCCIPVYAYAENPLLTFCLSEPPKVDDPRRSFFDSVCPGIIANEILNQGASDSASQATSSAALSKAQLELAKAQSDLAKAQADAKLAEANAAATALKGLATTLQPADTKLTDLSGFTAASQRFQANLGYTVGGEIGQALGDAIAANKLQTGGLVLFTNNPDTARQWVQNEDPNTVIKDLGDQTDNLNGAVVTLDSCMDAAVREGEKPAAKPAKPGKSLIGEAFGPAELVIATAGIEAAISLARFVGDAMQPKITTAASVNSPTGMLDAVLAGIFTTKRGEKTLGQELIITMNPPNIQGDNRVMVAAKEASQAASNAADQIEKMKNLKVAEKIKETADKCIKAAATTVSSASEIIKVIGAVGSDQVHGSRLERAARTEAIATTRLVGIALLTPVASGGAVATYQPRWPLGPRLVTAADFAIAYRVQDPNSGSILMADYISKGCGRTLPVGSFSEEYKSSNCE